MEKTDEQRELLRTELHNTMHELEAIVNDYFADNGLDWPVECVNGLLIDHFNADIGNTEPEIEDTPISRKEVDILVLTTATGIVDFFVALKEKDDEIHKIEGQLKQLEISKKTNSKN